MIFGAYSQVPPGTPHTILQSLLSGVYKPVLTYIYQNPEIRIHLYLSVTVLEWFEQNHPEMNMLIADLVKKDQVELLTGTSEQAVLPLLQPKDRSQQIEETTTYIRKRFQKRPKSLWLYNQIWAPNLVSVMRLSLVDRLIISNYLQQHDSLYLDEPFIMQDIGKSIEIVPLQHRLEQMVDQLGKGELSASQFEEILNLYGPEMRSSSAAVMINLDALVKASERDHSLADPGELFTLICQTLVIPEGTEALLASIPVRKLTQVRGYLPMGWYGYDSFLNSENNVNDMFFKYEELNHLYGRMHHVSELARVYRKNKDIKKRVEIYLRRAQNGAPFVRDVFGGCYRREYRQYVYRQLNEAENLLSHHEDISYPREADLDFDGEKEILAMSRNLLVVIHTRGARLQEMNYLPTGWNYLNTFTGYQREAQRTSLHSLVDGTFQNSFHDVLLPHDGFDYSRYSRRHASVHDTATDEWVVSIDERKSQHILYETSTRKLKIQKGYSLKNNSIVVDYTVTNISPGSLKGVFATELNLSLGTGEEKTQLYSIETNKNRVISDTLITKSINNFRIGDNVNKTILSVASNTRFSLMHLDYSLRMDTIEGEELLYEHTLFLLNWQYALEPGESSHWTVGWRIDKRPTRRQKEQS